MNANRSKWHGLHWSEAGDSPPEAWQELASSVNARVFYRRDDKIYLKFFREPRFRNRLKAALFPPLARYRCFVRNSRKLLERGLTAPAILDYGLIRDSETKQKVGYVVTQAFDGMGLGSFCSQYLVRSSADPRIRRWKRRVMEALGAEIARLHNGGISHGDLRPDNVLLSCVSPDPRFCFIDNERNRQHHSATPRRAIVKNLAQLNMIWPEDLSAAYRMRFMQSYLAHSTRSLDAPALIRHVHATSQRRLEGKARGGYLSSDRRQMCRPDFERLLRGV